MLRVSIGRYEYGDGSYVALGWYWLDGKQDGIAECYYFDADGRLLSNTMTPDGYEVNPDGAWVKNGTVMTKIMEEKSVEGENMLLIRIQIGSQEFEAKLYDNETVRELMPRLPMTIVMEELNGNEKYYYLSKSLYTEKFSDFLPIYQAGNNKEP